MIIKQEIQKRIVEFSDLCQAHKVKKLYAFGSSVSDNFNAKSSDIDLLIDIDEDDPVERGEKLMSIWDKLEELFNRKVDLLTDSSIRNPILRKNIDKTKVLIYDGQRQKVFI